MQSANQAPPSASRKESTNSPRFTRGLIRHLFPYVEIGGFDLREQGQSPS